MGGTTHTRRPEILKVDISKYGGVEEDSLLLWFVELDRAIKARRIDDEQMKLTYAQTHLAGRAKTWALGLEMRDPYAFGSLEAFKLDSNRRLSHHGLSSGLDQSFRNPSRVSVMCTLTLNTYDSSRVV